MLLNLLRLLSPNHDWTCPHTQHSRKDPSHGEADPGHQMPRRRSYLPPKTRTGQKPVRSWRTSAATMRVAIQFIHATTIPGACKVLEMHHHHGGMSSIFQACLKSGGNSPEFKKAYPDVVMMLIGLIETLASPNLPLITSSTSPTR